MAYDKETGREFDPGDPDQVAWNRSPNRGGDPRGVGGIQYPGPGWQARHPDYDSDGSFKAHHRSGGSTELARGQRGRRAVLSNNKFPLEVVAHDGGAGAAPGIRMRVDDCSGYAFLNHEQVGELRGMLDRWHDWRTLIEGSRGVIASARKDLGDDMTGLLDLLADNFPSEPLDTLRNVLHELGKT